MMFFFVYMVVYNMIQGKIKIAKNIQITRGTLKLDIFIISKVDRCKGYRYKGIGLKVDMEFNVTMVTFHMTPSHE
jgi:hypothetical protein